LERMHLGNDLRDVLTRDQLRVHFQPIVDLETGRPVEVEALVRWNHPTNGLMPPARFIPLAEDTGLIVPIGRWVLETACRQVRAWQRRLPAEPPVLLSVNVSALQLRSATFVDDVADILVRTGMDPQALKLEITESMLVRETDGLLETLERIRALGVKLVIDDFGTGYASLSYIKRFRVDAI